MWSILPKTHVTVASLFTLAHLLSCLERVPSPRWPELASALTVLAYALCTALPAENMRYKRNPLKT